MENFNLDFILKSGLKLLSSDTQKYEIKDSDLNLSSSSSLPVASNGSKASNNLVGKKNSTDPTESIREQRKLLNSKLGIDVGGAANLDTRDIFTDEDLLMASSSTTTTLSTDIQTKMLIKRKLSQENQFDLKAENIDIKQSVEEIILSNDSSGFKKIKSEFIESVLN